MMPQPRRPAAAGSAAGFTLVHCPSWTRVFSTKAPMPSAGVSSAPASGSPSAIVILAEALWVLKQYFGSPFLQARHSPHTARQLRTTKSPTSTWLTSEPIFSTMPAASWPRRKGNSSAMSPSR